MKTIRVVAIALLFAAGIFCCRCAPPKAEPVRAVSIPEDTIDPEVWGKAYPIEYELWKKTAEPNPPGKSKYKKGNDYARERVDKLSEYPYMAMLFQGWGFGIEYNEPRGHAHMVQDQLDIDASRLKAGGVCLSCKSPYTNYLVQKLGADYYGKPFREVLDQIPDKKNTTLGVACIDCHNPKDMTLRISRQFTLGEALREVGVDPAQADQQLKRSLVCAQCHVTYTIPKDKEMHSTGLFFPWQGSKLGAIPIENIIQKIRSDPAYQEWKQSVTGFKLGFIRHPEFELFSHRSVHWKAGASCADCHMPYTRVGAFKVSDHRIMSPLKNDFRACRQCHTEEPEWLRQQVITIQDRTVSLQIRSGYAVAVAAKLFQIIHEAQSAGKVVDQNLYQTAKDYYEEAFYRCTFIGAENSLGFHNPSETMRVLGDSIAFAVKAEGLLRQALTQAGVVLPAKIDLELAKYTDNRGTKKLNARKELEFPDPTGIQSRF